MTIYVSSGCFRTRSSNELIQLAAETGVAHVELSSGMAYSDDFMQPIRQAADRMTYLVHNYFPPPRDSFVLNLASTQPEALQKSKAMVRNGIDLCVEFGAPFYSVHAGFGIDLRPDDLGKPEIQARLPANRIVPEPVAYQQLCETVSELVAYAAERDINLLLENNVVTDVNVTATPSNMLWMATPDEFERLLSDVNHPRLGVLLDVGHLNVAANALQFDAIQALMRFRDVVGCLHLSENDGHRDTNQPVHADSWFMPFLPQFSNVPVVLEVYNISGNQLHNQISLVKGATHGEVK